MDRGFITIATGDLYYYQLAANLLLSYRCKTHDHYPFAIIAEEENEYTALFDDVIIAKDVTRSFLDKFLLLKYCPYNETIFFDADILAYGDLNKFWDYFNGTTDFSALGHNCGLYEDEAWYDVEGIKAYADMIDYKVRVHMGVCFIRKSTRLIDLYNSCIDIINNYDKLTINICPQSKDEVAMGIAMPMNNMRAVEEPPECIAALPCMKTIKASILSGKCEYTNVWGVSAKNVLLIHFGTSQTYKCMYRFEVECLKKIQSGKTESLSFFLKYRIGLRKIILKLFDFIYFIKSCNKRIINKIFHK